MNTPAFPCGCICRHSTSMMKFSYIRSVLIVPVGFPVLTIMPSFAVNVFGATFTITQPDKSLPLNSGWKFSSALAVDTIASRKQVAAIGWRIMARPLDRFLGCWPNVAFGAVDFQFVG